MIGKSLKRLRSIYGFKASDFSEKLGISPSYLSEIENEKKQPNLDLLQKYADIFQIKLSSLILIAETYDEAETQGKGDNFIGKMMIRLIEKMSFDEESNEKESLPD